MRLTDDRFWMLETILDYSVERLAESGEAPERRDRHATYFLELAECLEPELAGEQQANRLDALEQDYPNMRAALEWLLDSGDDGRSLRLAGALRSFWFRRGYLSEGRRWLDQALATPAEPTSARAKALAAAGLLASLQGDWAETRRWSEAGRDLSVEIGEPRYAAWALLALGRVTLADEEPERAVAIYEEAARYGQEAGDVIDTLPIVSFNLGYIALNQGDYEEAQAQFKRAVEQFGRDHYGVARSLAALGSVAINQGHNEAAIATLQRSLEASREVVDKDDIAWAVQLLGVAWSPDDPLRAARLLGAAEAMREALGGRLEGLELKLHESALASIAGLDVEAVADAWAAGRRLSLDDAIAFALAGRNEAVPTSR